MPAMATRAVGFSHHSVKTNKQKWECWCVCLRLGWRWAGKSFSFGSGWGQKNLRYFLSTGQDGFWDTEVIEKEFARVYIIDKDKDGRADVTGYDYDKDGTIDKYQKMTGWVIAESINFNPFLIESFQQEGTRVGLLLEGGGQEQQKKCCAKFLPNQCIVGFRAKEWADPSIINQFI